MNISRKTLIFFIIVVLSLKAQSQQTAEKFNRELRYLLYLPEGYSTDNSQRWPLMIFLHGSGESGTDLNKVKMHGPPALVEKGKKFPFIIVSPQSDGRFGWDPNELYYLLASLKEKYKVDKSRIYLTGLSMGGYGSWKFASTFPGEFAAIIPICGGGDTATAWKLRHIAVWAFHGAKDDVVLPEESKRMVKAVRYTNPSARLTIYPEANHNSWTEAYNTDSLYEWMLSKKKFMYKENPVKKEVLDELSGTYVSRRDTLVISPLEGKLQVKINRSNSVILRPASDSLFFINEEEPVDVEFIKKGKQRSLIVNADSRDEFRKLP
ncbi:MAG: hypothetical protein EOO01_26580 [Chitinophagaceae bacterium]|nr:MAG: hypothetical protein EOO01_26580 [Chitinophagaceae bacterium]